MKKMILSALMASWCLVRGQTSHDDPIGGENGSVRLFFLKRTMLDRGKVPGGIPPNQIWQHTHQGATYLMVDPGDGKVQAIHIDATSVVDIALGAKSGNGYGGQAGSLRIRAVNKPGSGMFVQGHLDAFEAIRRERCPGAAPSGQLMVALQRSLSLDGPWTDERKNAHGRTFRDWRKTVCPAANAELSKHMADMDVVWETTLTPNAFGNPNPVAANRVLYTLSGTPDVRMVSLTVSSPKKPRQSVEMKGADCARFVLCSHEQTKNGQTPCALPAHSTRGNACPAWRDRTGYDTGIKIPN